MSEKPSKHRFTFTAGAWVAMDLWMEDGGSVGEHASPIRIDRVRPLGAGRSEVELGFFHACYSEGVQDKVYRLRILHRSRHQLLRCSSMARAGSYGSRRSPAPGSPASYTSLCS
jgi:hypothetical protein